MITGLGRPEHRDVLTQLRTARAWGVPISTIRHGHPPTDWSRMSDRQAAVALTEYEDGLHSCGHPRAESFDDESDGRYEVREAVCYACAARELWQKDNDDPAALEPGTQVYLVDLQRFPEA